FLLVHEPLWSGVLCRLVRRWRPVRRGDFRSWCWARTAIGTVSAAASVLTRGTMLTPRPIANGGSARTTGHVGVVRTGSVSPQRVSACAAVSNSAAVGVLAKPASDALFTAAAVSVRIGNTG